jgi:hypothetical protein
MLAEIILMIASKAWLKPRVTRGSSVAVVIGKDAAKPIRLLGLVRREHMSVAAVTCGDA